MSRVKTISTAQLNRFNMDQKRILRMIRNCQLFQKQFEKSDLDYESQSCGRLHVVSGFGACEIILKQVHNAIFPNRRQV